MLSPIASTQIIQSKKNPLGGTNEVRPRYIIPAGMKPGDKALAIPLVEVECRKPAGAQHQTHFTINDSVMDRVNEMPFQVMA
jgi:hypothetical protein